MTIDFKKTKGWIILAIIVVIVLMIAITYFKKLIKKDPENNTQNQAKSDIAADPSNLSYDIQQYNLYADQIQGCLDQLWRDQDGAIAVFKKMKTKDDINQLIISFGQRKPSSFFVFGPAANLTEWITSCFSSSQLSDLNSAISSTGYQF